MYALNVKRRKLKVPVDQATNGSGKPSTEAETPEGMQRQTSPAAPQNGTNKPPANGSETQTEQTRLRKVLKPPLGTDVSAA